MQVLLEGAGQAEWWELCVRQGEQLEQKLGGDIVWSVREDSQQMVPFCWGKAVVRGRDAAGVQQGWGLTFIMSTMVLSAIMAMMVYSKGGDTTNCHMRYWKLCLFWGMCRVRGLALMAKSMQALCGRQANGVRARGGQRRIASTLPLARHICLHFCFSFPQPGFLDFPHQDGVLLPTAMAP